MLTTGYTKVTFPTTPRMKYALQEEGYERCAFSHWSDGTKSSELVVLAKSGDQTLTAVFDC